MIPECVRRVLFSVLVLVAAIFWANCHLVFQAEPDDPPAPLFFGCYAGILTDPPGSGKVRLVLEPSPEPSGVLVSGCIETGPVLATLAASLEGDSTEVLRATATPAGGSPFSFRVTRQPGGLVQATAVDLENVNGSPFQAALGLPACAAGEVVSCAELGLPRAPGKVIPAELGDLAELPFVVADSAPPTVSGPVDSRFFGTFCQPSPRKFCKSVPLLQDPCVTLRDTRVQIDHRTTPRGGLLSGGGSFVLDGDRGVLVLAGAVVGSNVQVAGIRFPGSVARFVAPAPGLGEESGIAALSADGVELIAYVQGRSLVLRKDACGNNPPTVGLTAPAGPSFPLTQSVMLVGHISDEDTSFPPERLVFRSDRQGVLAGLRAGGGRTLFVSSLIPGPHHITFTVTDSGGLTRSAGLDLTILNRPPQTPRIFLPAEGATLSAGAPVLLQGSALDPDSGFLTGGSLQWTAQSTAGGPFVPLGSGREVGTAFPTPVEPLRLRLTARDNTGLTSFTERLVRVVPGGTNAPPVVVIRQPDRTTIEGPVVANYLSLEPASFVGTAFDTEDETSDLTIVWEVVAITGIGGQPLATPPVPNPAPVVGTLAPVVSFHPSANLFYRVTLKVTDQGGATSTDSIEIFTFPTPIL